MIKDRVENLPVQVKASFWFMICLFLQRGISAITTPIFTRLLSTSDYGVYGAYTSWLEIFTVLVTLNLFSGVYTQGLVKFQKEREQFASAMQVLVLLLSAGWTILYALLRPVLNGLLSLTTWQMTGMLVTIWCEAAFSLWAGEQRVRYAYRALIIVTLIASVCKPLFGILLILRFPGEAATARIWGVALADLLCYAWLFFFQTGKGGLHGLGKWWRYAISYNVVLIPHFLSQIIMFSADRIMIRDMVGASEAGIYDLANTISNIMAMFNSAILQTINPWIYEKIRDKEVQRIEQISDPALIIIALVNLVLIAFAPELVFLFAPAAYHDAIWVIPPIAMGVFFRFSYNLFADFTLYYERVGRVAVASVIGAIVNITLNLLLIPRFGYFAAGYTTLISFMVYAVMHFIFMTDICKTQLQMRQPYSVRFLLGVTVLFLAAGFLFTVSYLYLPLRIGMITVFAVGLLWNRKRIMALAKPFLRS